MAAASASAQVVAAIVGNAGEAGLIVAFGERRRR